MRAFLRDLFGTGTSEAGRNRGRPPSPNGASSFHLRWRAPGHTKAVRVTLEVIEPPQTRDLYFFALQATFAGDEADSGGAHIGLQWNARHPGTTAVNWGGYRSQSSGGSVLEGTESSLPSQPNDPNTRDYAWQPHRPYRLTIEPGSDVGWWRGSVTDMQTGVTTVIRELHGGGRWLSTPMVWSEVFAPCDAPPVAVRWTNLETESARGGWQPVDLVDVNYQHYNAGGCSNTDSSVDVDGFVQRTNTGRSTPQGATLAFGSEGLQRT